MTTFGLAAGPISTGPPAPGAREAGTVFVRTKPKLAAYTHLVSFSATTEFHRQL